LVQLDTAAGATLTLWEALQPQLQEVHPNRLIYMHFKHIHSSRRTLPSADRNVAIKLIFQIQLCIIFSDMYMHKSFILRITYTLNVMASCIDSKHLSIARDRWSFYTAPRLSNDYAHWILMIASPCQVLTCWHVREWAKYICGKQLMIMSADYLYCGTIKYLTLLWRKYLPICEQKYLFSFHWT